MTDPTSNLIYLRFALRNLILVASDNDELKALQSEATAELSSMIDILEEKI